MFDFSGTISQLDLFARGALVTIIVSMLGALLGIAVGVVVLFSRRSRWAPIRAVGAVYVSLVRGTPLLVQIFVVYYALPGLMSFDLPAFPAGVLALSLNSGAFVSEILRGGLTSIPKQQFEGGMALGLRRSLVWLLIILPQLFRLVIPSLVNEYTILVKASPLLSVITVVELTRTAQNIMNVTYRPVEAFAVAAAFYFVILFALSSFARLLERRLMVKTT